MIRLGLAICMMMGAVTTAMAREANHLLGSVSPYLQQHLYNPVDWYPWADEALARAKEENKLIFVSVGYSSCHWCHVMEEESFENEAIAAFLNEHFVSIKIDRESRPDLDEQFMFATQVLTGGGGGWPNSVFLTPSGDPFFAGTYFPPGAFHTVLFQVVQAWQGEPDFVASEGARASTIISGFLTSAVAAREVTPETLELVTDNLLDEMDSFSGGYGQSVKFPREAMMLFLLDQSERNGDRDALDAVTAALDGMLKGGIHDHVGGGFHRYAIDPEWHIPHFEKMLYNQALIGRLLVRTWKITGAPRYRRAAERTFAYVLRDMTDPEGGFYSAQDADSMAANGDVAEGAFYVWTPQQLTDLSGAAELVSDIYQITGDGDLEGANVLNLLEFPDVTALELGQDPVAIAATLDAALAEMFDIRARREAPFTDRKVIASWNAEMIATLAEAAHVFDAPAYRDAAEKAALFVLDQMEIDGQLQRIWFDGTAGTPAQLADYAALGLAFLALHDYAPDSAKRDLWLGHATRMAWSLQVHFGAPDTGFRMTAQRDGFSDIVPVDDTEIPSGNALALALYSRLADRMSAPEFEQAELALSAALSGRALEIPTQRTAALAAIDASLRGEVGPVRHVAMGNVRVRFDLDKNKGQLKAMIEISDGWHINAHEPLEDYFIATELRLDSGETTVFYPEALEKSLSFNTSPLALYEGTVVLTADLPDTAISDGPRQAMLTLQACSDEICLQPEEIGFTVW